MVHQMEAMMQDSIRAESEKPSRLSNPLLDLAVAGLEAQLKAWQAFQVEGAQFVAKRMRCNLEQLRSLGHCGDIQSMGACQLAWLNDVQKDYAEECGRIAGTSFTLGFADLTGLGWLFGKRTAEGCREPQPGSQSTGKPKSPLSLQAAA
jgi:hypothetical protein